VDFEEAVARLDVVVHDRIRRLRADERLRVAASAHREARFAPHDSTFIRLWVEIDDGEIPLGLVPRALFRESPPSPS
jgi:hypothetical protein